MHNQHQRDVAKDIINRNNNLRVKDVNEIIKVMVIALLLSVSGSALHAHGVQAAVSRSEAMVVRAGYDTGEPMAYASVKVFAPDEHKIEYQNGRTDRAGVFSFCPDKSGEWLVVVDDGSGHGFQKKIEVDNVPDVMTAPAGPGAAQKILMVVCVLWGFAGFWFFFRRRSGA